MHDRHAMCVARGRSSRATVDLGGDDFEAVALGVQARVGGHRCSRWDWTPKEVQGPQEPQASFG